jgi:hypothetical protein
MSWIQENKVPAAILGLTGAGVVGLGVVLFNAWSAASAAQESYDAVNISLANLKSAPLGPTPENLAQKKAAVDAYKLAVGKLSTVLYTLQPEDKPTTNTDFQAKLKAKIAEIKKDGAGHLPAEFNLGFDQYTSELPKSDQVAAELSTYLDSVDSIVRLFLKSGIKSIDLLERSALPSEKGEPEKPKQQAKSKAKGVQTRQAPAPVSITDRRQVRIMMRADQAAIQTLLSGLASPSEMPFFTVVRLLRIENEAQVGPPRTSGLAPTQEPPPGEPPTPGPDGAAKPVPTGIQPASPDSFVVLGRETLRAYIEIDLVKFLNPQAQQSAGASGSR